MKVLSGYDSLFYNRKVYEEQMKILDEIAKAARVRVEKKKSELPLSELVKRAEELGAETGFPFEEALRGEEISFICEVKRASPSRGVIAEHFPYLEIAKEYEAAGAAAISCLTEPEYFLGSDQYLREIAREVRIPVLRKDFTVDAYQIYEAKVLGADAVLLICSLLNDEELAGFRKLADSLGLSALVEAHDETEIQRAVEAGARVIGVNNRNLKDFTVNVENSLALRKYVPEEAIFVAESGIRTGEDVEKLRAGRVQAVLIGEALMRSPDKKKTLETLRGY